MYIDLLQSKVELGSISFTHPISVAIWKRNAIRCQVNQFFHEHSAARRMLSVLCDAQVAVRPGLSPGMWGLGEYWQLPFIVVLPIKRCDFAYLC